MNTPSLLRSTLVVSILLFGSRAANAACLIRGVRPTVPLPTMGAGQEFSFIATADCERLRFRVPGTTLTKIPTTGPDLGSEDRTYKVVLTESEWSSVVDESDTTFTWTIIGTTSAGVTTRVTTTNELRVYHGLDVSDAKLVGEERGDTAGYSVSGAGDVNGDGHDDLLVGAPANSEGGRNAGAAYLVLGPVTGTLNLSLANAKLVGEDLDGAGGSVSGAGDVDGDGHDDVLIGAAGNDEGGPDAGAAYLVLGPVTGTLDLSLADAKLVGEEPYDYAGDIVSDAGDIDGDGHDDLLVGHNTAVYVVLGPVTGTLNLSLADGALDGVSDYWGDWGSWASLSAAGDVDADGHDDFVVGSPGADKVTGLRNVGAAYLVLGPVTGTVDPFLADAKLVGETVNDYAGNSVSGAGDVDGDSHDDLLIGAKGNAHETWASGAAYLVLGPVTGRLDLALADAKLVGEAGDHAGASVSGAGDVDGDGHDDLLVNARTKNDAGRTPGAAYVVLGPVTGTFDLSLADATLVGEERGDEAGYSLSGAGDVDGDGHDDLLIGAPYNSRAAGAAYLVYGGGLF